MLLRKRTALTLLWGGLLLQSMLPPSTMFEEVPASYSGIQFNNSVEVYTDPLKADGYPYRYNASGVGVGDFNNDGLPDLFFSGNTVASKLYLNQGKFVFKDVSAAAGIGGSHTWGTGVSVVDINGDGLLDVFVCHSGNFTDSSKLKNELFINLGLVNGVPHFRESAAQYGLALPGTHTTQAAFFDYDHDGDLDVFIINHGLDPYQVLHNADFIHSRLDPLNSNMLLRNDKGHFVNVSRSAGIIGSNLNFGLGVIITDINNDGWPDIYCTNDYLESDFLYINAKNGRFRETGGRSFTHFSAFSMGTDAADYNNDGLMDLVTLDMKAHDNYRQKISMMSDNEDDFSRNVSLGFRPQYVRNMLQVNSGIDQQGVPHFIEMGQMSGIAETDWSWSPLFADFDNDGWKDLFVSAGYADDMSLDRRNRFLRPNDPAMVSSADNDGAGIFKSNSFFFRNEKGAGFSSSTKAWKPEKYAMSYAAVYADFDNDGRLDMLVSNLNETPTLLRNQQPAGDNHYLSVALQQPGMNRFALGARVKITADGRTQLQDLSPVRGYQSSQDYTLHFGLGTATSADLEITWPDGTVTEQHGIKVDQHLNVSKSTGLPQKKVAPAPGFTFKETVLPNKDSFISRQWDHPDFKYQFSLPYKVSDFGQVVTAGDINGDGLMDYYVGGEAGSEKFFMLGNANGAFTKFNPNCFELADENCAALFVDADKDGDPDLVIESRLGSTDQPQLYYTDTLYRFRFFENLGKGKFAERVNVLPGLSTFKTIAAGDVDRDGDADLFIGGYPSPMNFGRPLRSYVLQNNSTPGKIVFTDITAKVLPDANLGMVSGAEWKDMDGDGYPELLVSTEWGSCKLLRNEKGVLKDISVNAGLNKYTGLWSCIYPADVNGDGYTDLVAGNIGNNNSFHISTAHPAKLNMIDFENGYNGQDVSVPVVSAWYDDGHEYLNLYRDELLSVSQKLRPLFNTYDSYARADLQELTRKAAAKIDTVYTCNTSASGVFMNDGNNHFRFEQFPAFAQVSRINTAILLPVQNALPDLLLAGNFFGYRVQYGRQDALPVLQVKNTPEGMLAELPAQSGLFASGQVSRMYLYSVGDKKRILLFKKNEAPQVFEYDRS